MNPQTDLESPRLAPIFGDHMVLQCEQSIAIWGTSVPGDKLTIRLGSTAVSTNAADDGKFKTTLPKQPPGGPFELSVESTNGRLVIRDVLCGEVWLCVGQSNMVWPVKRSTGAEQLIAEADFPQMRLRPLTGTEGIACNADDPWKLCSPECIADFSAVAYLSGRELHQRLKRPVGLMLAAWSGTHNEIWMSREDLLAGEQSGRDLLTYEACRAGDFSAFAPPESKSRVEWASPDLDDREWPLMPMPGLWQDSGYFHHGVLWVRRQLGLPNDWACRNLEISLGRCLDEDQTYFNGELVGSTNPGKPGEPSKSRRYIVDGKLVRPGGNTLAVRISTYREGGGFPDPASALSIRPLGAHQSESIPLAGAWRFQVELQKPMRNVAVHGWLNPRGKTPHELYDKMIAPLIPFTFRGVFWYQGEQNCWQAFSFRKLFPQLIRAWRSRWGRGSLPFVYVQVPNARHKVQMPQESEWAELREAQSMALAEPNTAMAVTIDCGGVDLHPLDKTGTARRLAAAALGTFYRLPVPHRSPHYLRHTRQGNAIRVEFALEPGASLRTNDECPVHGFTIAGDDRRFVWASAVIEGISVVVWNPDVPQPVAVRYAWANNPDCNLYDSSGLPAEPFRTDSWPGLTWTN